MGDRDEKAHPSAAPSVKSRDGQASPVAIAALALVGGIGYFAWRFWKKFQEDKDRTAEASRTAGSQSEEASVSGRSKSKGSAFTFDRQPRGTASTSGRPAAPPSSSSQSKSRRDPKPKMQKQLRKEAMQAKKAAREQTARDAENAQLAAAIAKRAKEVGLGQQPPEPQKQYYVDYEGVTDAYDKIVEWQQTGKKKY